MSAEILPAILFVNSPQTSKDENLPKTDLLGNKKYRAVVRVFDSKLKLIRNGSLHPDRQIASVVNSVGTCSAFVNGLDEMLTPGLVLPGNRPYRLKLTGHSVGEMASFIEAGVCDVPTMAWMLNERERITEDPLGSGLRLMVAAVGVDPDKLEEYFDHLRQAFIGQAELFLANTNTPRQVVLSIRVLQGKAEAIVDALPQNLSRIINPLTGQPFFPRVRVSRLKTPNAFHSAAMLGEEVLFKGIITPRLTEQYFKVPPQGVIYSPMSLCWVNSLEAVFDIMQHQLTKPVRFTEAMREIIKIPNLRMIVTADPIGTTPNMIKGNIGNDIPIANIKDRETLKQAVDLGFRVIKQAS